MTLWPIKLLIVLLSVSNWLTWSIIISLLALFQPHVPQIFFVLNKPFLRRINIVEIAHNVVSNRGRLLFDVTRWIGHIVALYVFLFSHMKLLLSLDISKTTTITFNSVILRSLILYGQLII